MRRLVAPVFPRRFVVDVFRPGIDYALARHVGIEGRFRRFGERFPDQLVDLAGCAGETADVVNASRQFFSGGVAKVEKSLDRFGHGDEGDLGAFPDEAVVLFAFGRGVDHFRSVVRCSAGGQRESAYDAREADAAEIEAVVALSGIVLKLHIIEGEVRSEVLAGQFVAAVHGRRRHELLFAYEGVCGFHFKVRQTVHGDGGAEHHFHADVILLRLLHGAVKNARSAHDVDVAGLVGNAFRARGKQSRQMIDLIEIVGREDLV